MNRTDIELVSILGRDGAELYACDVETAHRLRLPHRVVGIFVLMSSGELVVQVRANDGRLDISAGGHVKHNEGVHEAARRELEEELGLSCQPLHLLDYTNQSSVYGHVWSLYFVISNEEFHFVRNSEVEDVRFYSWSELVKLTTEAGSNLTVGLVNAVAILQNAIGAESLAADPAFLSWIRKFS